VLDDPDTESPLLSVTALTRPLIGLVRVASARVDLSVATVARSLSIAAWSEASDAAVTVRVEPVPVVPPPERVERPDPDDEPPEGADPVEPRRGDADDEGCGVGVVVTRCADATSFSMSLFKRFSAASTVFSCADTAVWSATRLAAAVVQLPELRSASQADFVAVNAAAAVARSVSVACCAATTAA
jgi:hypothetical protein